MRHRRHNVVYLERPYSPRRESGLALWLDGSTGLFQDAAGTTPAVADTDPVGLWKDQSGNGRDATQATAGLRPLLKTGVLGGQNAVRFDGVDDLLTGSLAATPTAYTVFVVMESTATGTDLGVWRLATDATRHGVTHHNGTTLYSYFTSGTGSVNGTLNLNSERIVASVYDGGTNVSGMHLFKDGVQTASKSGSPATTNLTADYALGERVASTGYFGGDIAELIIYNRALTVAELNRVGRYLARKYGRTWTEIHPNPRAYSGLLSWYAAWQGTFQLSGGTTAATANNDPVGYLTDLSTNGAHVVQATAGLRPLLKTNIIGGRPVVRFDGVDDLLAGTLASAPTAYTVFLVLTSSASGTDPGLWRLNSSAYTHGMTHHNGSTLYLYLGNGSKNINVSLATSTALILAAIYDGGTTQAGADLFKAGVAAVTKDGTPSPTGLSTTIAFGERAAGVGYAAYDLAEFAVYNRVLGGEERQAVAAGLAAFYGLTWTPS